MAKKKKDDWEPNNLLDSIIQYEMDDMEAKAMRIVVMWLDRSRKLFPDYLHAKMGKGDPRKSLIFKICYKLVRETNGLIPDEEYSLYVRAQLDVLRHINSNRGTPLIDPNCLVGEKAWRRWKLWKKRYDALRNTPKTQSIKVNSQSILKAISGLEATKEFLVKSWGEITENKYREAYLNNNLLRWFNMGKISPYYLAISSRIKAVFKPEDYQRLHFDPAVYLPCIDETVQQKFKELFPGEPLSLEPQGDEATG